MTSDPTSYDPTQAHSSSDSSQWPGRNPDVGLPQPRNSLPSSSLPSASLPLSRLHQIIFSRHTPAFVLFPLSLPYPVDPAVQDTQSYALSQPWIRQKTPRRRLPPTRIPRLPMLLIARPWTRLVPCSLDPVLRAFLQLPTRARALTAPAFLQIRLRRLAKLGSSSKPADSPDQAAEQSGTPRRSGSNTPKSEDASSTAANPPTPRGLRPSAPATAPNTPKHSASTNKRPVPSDAESAETRKPPPRKQNILQPVSLEDFSDRVLTDVLRATVDPAKASDHVTFLPELSEGLKDSDEPLKLSLDNIDAAIIEAASAWPREKSLLSYFLPCWSRAQEKKSSPPRDADEAKMHVLNEAKRLCVSNSLFAVTVPDLFG